MYQQNFYLSGYSDFRQLKRIVPSLFNNIFLSLTLSKGEGIASLLQISNEGFLFRQYPFRLPCPLEMGWR